MMTNCSCFSSDVTGVQPPGGGLSGMGPGKVWLPMAKGVVP